MSKGEFSADSIRVSCRDGEIDRLSRRQRDLTARFGDSHVQGLAFLEAQIQNWYCNGTKYVDSNI